MPISKWPGGKRRQAGEISALLLPRLMAGAVYCEPFFGAGAVFFALRASGWEGPAVIAEAVPAQRELLALLASPFTTAPREIYERISALDAAYWAGGAGDAERSAHERKGIYLAERRSHNAREGCTAERAARWLWLLARSFSGLVRHSRAGEYNAAHGDGTGRLPRLEELQRAALALRGVIVCADWIQALEATAGRGRVIYADPPYMGTFAGYAREGWSACDRDNLSRWLRDAAGAGARVVVSEGEGAHGAYPWAAHYREVTVTYVGGGGHRGRETKEVLLWSE